jgi:hypothetical protein
MVAVRELEVLRRRVDAATDRLAGHLDTSGAYGIDGHRNAKAALKHLGRLPGPEAAARVRTARMLRRLPAVAAAYERGEIPTASVRAIVRVVANPRVEPFLDVADPVFADLAATDSYHDFVRWLQQWEALADADGAEQDAEGTHQRRNAAIAQNAADLSWHLRAHTGALQGAAMADIFAAYEAAEFETDRQHAIAEHGEAATVDQFPRTPAQRRADALFAIFRAAAATPADAQLPVPLVNIITDDATLDDEIRRAAGGDPDQPGPDGPDGPDPERVERRRCHTVTGHPLHPSDVLAATLIGYVRRVVVDAAGTIIDLGRRRRCFTGSSRDAAILQGAIRARGGTACFWAACNSPPHRLQVDHHDPWHQHGPTDIANSDLACGYHNRLKEAGYRPVHAPDGTWTLTRPDGTPITPAA